MEPWTLRTKPAHYLASHPQGLHAELARALVEDEKRQYFREKWDAILTRIAKIFERIALP